MTARLSPEREAEIAARAEAATPGPWDVHAHAHGSSGCRCLSCDDPIVGFAVDHPKALDCDDIVAARSGNGELNGFGRTLDSCDQGPLLPYEDADFAAHARTDVPALLAELAAVRAERDQARRALEEIRHLHKDSPMGPCPLCVDGDALARGDDPTVPYPCPTARLAGAQDCDPPSFRTKSSEEPVR